MKNLIILLLTLILIISIFCSCQNKSYNIDFSTEASGQETTEATPHTPDTSAFTEAYETEEYVDTIETIDGTEAGANNDTVDTTVYPTDYNYILKKVGNQWYMVFDTYVHRPWNGQYSEIFFDVDSVESFKNRIIHNELGEWEKECIVANFERDDVGILIPDMDNLLNPTLPQGVSVYQVFWTREQYGVSFMDESYSAIGSAIDGAMYIIDESAFMKQYNIASSENIYVSEDGKKIIVLLQVKNQYIDIDYLYVKLDDNYAYFKISGMPENPNKDLIMSFGFEICE